MQPLSGVPFSSFPLVHRTLLPLTSSKMCCLDTIPRTFQGAYGQFHKECSFFRNRDRRTKRRLRVGVKDRYNEVAGRERNPKIHAEIPKPGKQCNKQMYRIRVRINRVQGQAEIMKPKKTVRTGRKHKQGVKNRNPKNRKIQIMNIMSQGQLAEKARTGGRKNGAGTDTERDQMN